MDIKPIIELKDPKMCPQSPGLWRCHDDYLISGFGNTPQEAYDNWKSKESLRTRIPRRFVWNLKSCMDWYNRGCPTIRSYVGHRLIVSYDKITDQLVLRG